MLREIRISNLAIVPESHIVFDQDLNILTGETGAGKSILLDAVGLLAGKRAQSGEVRTGADQAVIEGVVSMSANSPALLWLKSMGFESEQTEVILRRIVAADGRSRAFINDANTTAGALAEFANFWLDMTGQHSQQKLLDATTHLDILDGYAHLQSLRDSYVGVFHDIKTIDRDIQKLKNDQKKILEQREYYEFRLKELKEADLKLNEDLELKIRHDRMAHQGKLLQSVTILEELFLDQGGVSETFSKIQQELRSMSKFDESWVQKVEQMDQARIILDDIHAEVLSFRNKLDVDPEDIEEMNARLSLLQKISRKFGSIEKAIEEREAIVKSLSSSEESDLLEKELLEKRKTFEVKLKSAAETLSSARKKSIKKFSSDVTKELKNLGMTSAELSIVLTPVSASAEGVAISDSFYGPLGAETAEFYFSANPGESARPLSAIASGGELSRVLLSLKGIALIEEGAKDLTYIFDEVDAGIGGETAERVGQRLKVLARGRQVLCVTHLAQVACYADTHLKVEKNVVSGRTVSVVKNLKEDERKKELARMIGGIEITQKTQDHASELFMRASDIKTSSLTR